MADTTARALALLDLLQRHRHWTGAELAERLDTTERTIRRDVDRLRELGYRIGATPGRDGGYRLESGGTMPPLLLSEDEAVAIAVGLRVAAAEQLVDGTATALSALAKLEQVLEPQLRRKVTALAQSMTAPDRRSSPNVSPDLLGQAALACRDRERVRFTYTDGHGRETRRRVEPQALVPTKGRWYLVAWDLGRDDWRTFRLDRLTGFTATGAQFEARALSHAELHERVLVASMSTAQPLEASARVEMGIGEFTQHMGVWAEGATEPSSGTTDWPLGGENVRDLFYGLSWLPDGAAYSVDMPDDARVALTAMIERVLDALQAPASLRGSAPAR